MQCATIETPQNFSLTEPTHVMLINHCRFGDSKGVNYLQFLEHLQPTEALEDKYKTRMTQLSTKRETV